MSKMDFDSAHEYPDPTQNVSTPEQLDSNFDAIVVGAGAAGGLAALMLCEGGARVLVLDAGLPPSLRRAPFQTTLQFLIKNWADLRFLKFVPPRLVYKGRQALKLAGRLRQPIQSQCYAWERLPEVFVDDIDSPYTTPEDKPFTWIRAWTIGGRLIVPGHGRQYYRLNRQELNSGAGLGPPWPIDCDELDPWYAAVEKRIGLSGEMNGLACPPDSELGTILQRLPSETTVVSAIKGRWPQADAILGRYAPPFPSIDLAGAAGRLTRRSGAVCQKVELAKTGRVSGVVWYDRQTGREMRAQSNCVFLCASTLETTRILLTSAAANGQKFGVSSGVLGHYLMDHIVSKIESVGPASVGDPVSVEEGRCVYLPRFDNRNGSSSSSEGGFGVQLYETAATPGKSYFTAVAFSEMAPRAENKVSLSSTKIDAWGMPCLHIDCAHGEREKETMDRQLQALREVAAVLKLDPSRTLESLGPPGLAIHECGTARMGDDPRRSVLDPNNQCWDTKGLYVTDGACFPSQGGQHPTLTIMALTARACQHALQHEIG
jgi:choline dehydrogenase-like flavoprotein